MDTATPTAPPTAPATAAMPLVVNYCSICKVNYVDSKEEHMSTGFHRYNCKHTTILTLEQYKKRTHSRSLAQIHGYKSSGGRASAAIIASKATKDLIRASRRIDTKHEKYVPIKKLVAEHSHNNHHGLPGSNKYSHRGPCSTPGQNNSFRGKRDRK